MRVLVTGATGFTGGHLARQLAARGYQVRALLRGRADAQAGIDFVLGDLRDRASLERTRDAAAAIRDRVSQEAGITFVDVAEFELVLAHLRVPETV